MESSKKVKIVADCGGEDVYVLQTYNKEPTAADLEHWSRLVGDNAVVVNKSGRSAVFTRHVQAVRITR